MNTTLQQTPIAIVGMAGIFPQARNLNEYWENILQKRDCIVDVPPSRWSLDDYYDPDPTVPDKTYCKMGGFIPDIDFDPLEFGLPPNILEVTDVAQLLALVVAKSAMIDAGYGEAAEDIRKQTGIILGIGGGQKLLTPLTSRLQYPVWEKVLRSSGVSAEDTETIIEKIKLGYIEWNENSFPGMLGNVIAGRVANRLDLGGINCVVDAACASSLSALQMAVSELTEHRADMMITGGVDTDNSIFMYMSFSKTPALSPSGKARPFDAESDGMMLGEGLGMLVIKRLADAERDGDRIYAVIKGIGASSDGRYRSIYAPRASGQERALQRAYAEAGFEPSSVGLLEAHGTGTKAGDPVELHALKQVFGADSNEDPQPTIALGSVKSQIGHTKSAAGVASLLKTALALHHKILPPTINVTNPHESLLEGNSPLYLNTQTRPWLLPDGHPPRRAGVSSFGFGGTNFHVAMEEYQAEHEHPYRLHQVPQMILLHGDTPAQLRSICQEWIDRLATEDASAHFATLVADGRGQYPAPTDARMGFTATTVDEALERLQIAAERLMTLSDVEWEHPHGIYYRPHSIASDGKVVALFSGQGSQYVEMGRTLSMNFPQVRRAHAKMDRLLLADGLAPLSSVLFPPPAFTPEARTQQADRLRRTEYAQPAIGLLSFSLYHLLQRAGLQPDFVAGHSFGELTALWAAGVLTDDDYFALVKTRGQAMSAPDDPAFDGGAMLAVQADRERVTALMDEREDVICANLNSPRQFVLAGPSAAIAAAQERLEQQGITTRALPVSAAFHTPLVDHAVEPFTRAVQETAFQPAQIPVYANGTGEPYPAEPDAMRQTLAKQMAQPVLFQQSIENLYDAGGRIFIEIGPKAILTNLVKEILHDQPHLALAVNANTRGDSDRQLREAIIQLRVAGIALDEFDTYQLEPSQATASTAPATAHTNGGGKFVIRLNGANYVSEPTQRAFAAALDDDFQATLPWSATAGIAEGDTPRSNPHTGPAITAADAAHLAHDKHDSAYTQPGNPSTNGTVHAQAGEPLAHLPAAMHSPQADPALTQLLAEFYTIQAEMLQAHQQYLDHHIKESTTFFRLTEQQQQLGPTGGNGAAFSENMARFQAYQSETLRVHEQYLTNQMRYLELLFQQMQSQPGHPTNGAASPGSALRPASTHPLSGGADAGAADGMMGDPHRATPYAPIHYGPHAQSTQHSAATQSPFSGSQLGHMPFPAPAPVAPAPTAQSPSPGAPLPDAQIASTQPAAPLNSEINSSEINSSEINRSEIDVQSLTPQFLAVVSAKTGYPAEFLDLTMDMEADLGIDSIKRVEILGIMQEQIADLPTLRAADLAELRTLQEVIDHVKQQMPHGPTTQTMPTPQPSTPSGNGAVGVSAHVDITEQFLAVVSAKTGYPAEFLDLAMDMEADLGIDSIKRVEILGIMQEQIADLPTLRAADLAELRTLQEVIDYVEQQMPHGDNIKQQMPPAPRAAGTAENDVAAKRAPDPAPAAISKDADVEGTDAKNIAVQEYAVVRKSLPAPDALERTLPPGHCCLVTDSGDATVTHVAQRLTAQGWTVVVLSFPPAIMPPTSDLPEDVAHYVLPDMEEATLVKQLQQIEATAGPIAASIHLDPDWAQHVVEEAGPSAAPAQWLPPASEAVIQHVFLLAKHLGPTLQQAATAGSASFITVARLDGRLGLAEQSPPYSAVSGGLFGLTKSLNQEWAGVFCRAVDLAPTIPAPQAAAQVVAELHDPNRLVTEVGYGVKDGAAHRVTLATSPLAPREETPPPLEGAQIFLVSGGARGVTAQCVIALAQQTQGTFILLGRTTLAPEPEWAHGVVDEIELKRQIATQLQAAGESPNPRVVAEQFRAITACREIDATLGAVRAAGGQADYASVDVCNAAEVRQVIESAQERWGAITGLIHGAGVVADKRIEEKSQADLERVYRVKVAGLSNLLAAVEPEQLQSIVLFSSAAGFYGNAGQTDYALANEVLNKMAHLLKRQHPACRVRSINWGPWDGGMVTPALKAHFAKNNINVIPLDVGAEILVQQICDSATPVQTVVGDALSPPAAPSTSTRDETLRTVRIRRKLEEQANPFLQDHRIGDHAVLPITCAGAWLVHACEQRYPDFTFVSSQNLQVFKGIVFDDSLADEYVLELTELDKQPDVVRLEAKLSSDTEQGWPRNHYSLVCEVRRTIPAPPASPHQLDLTDTYPLQTYYTDGTLFHGPLFQGIQRIITLNECQIVLECRLPALTAAQQGQFPVQTFNPYTADSVFQGLLIWVRHQYEAGSLPLSAGNSTHYRPVGFDETFYVDTQIVQHSEQRALANVTIYNLEGKLCIQCEGAEVTISRELNRLFRGEA